MRIAIATGIYPPEIGGPAEYARQLYETLLIQEQEAEVITYGKLKKFPTLIRHFLYFCQLCFDALDCDSIIALDTWSAALPSVIFAKIFRKKIVVRVGGDFLWEAYCDRVKNPILLSKFYEVDKDFTFKEGIIFFLTKFILRSADGVVFSTKWQKDIMVGPYDLNEEKISIIENFFPKVESFENENFGEETKKVFLSPSRNRFIKNQATVEKAFRHVAISHPDIELDTQPVAHEVLLEKIKKCYALVVGSISEVSPNIVCEAIQYGIPVILTYDNGMKAKLEEMVLFVDPLSWADIARGIETMLDKTFYKAYREKISGSNYSHSWNEIAQEFLNIL